MKSLYNIFQKVGALGLGTGCLKNIDGKVTELESQELRISEIL